MQACVVGLAMFVALFLGMGGGKKAPDQDGVSVFMGEALSSYNEHSCDEKQPKKHPELDILCESSWLPFAGDLTDKASEVYWLFRAKPGQKPLIVRVATYADGSGALWVTTFVKKSGTGRSEPKAQVADLSPADLGPLLARLNGGDYWTLEHSLPGLTVDTRVQDPPDCTNDPVWILEGKKAESHRAVAVRTCTHAKWVLSLDHDILALARAKIPGFAE